MQPRDRFVRIRRGESVKTSRRRFLKIGCISLAGLGVTVCGGAGLAAALRSDLPPVDFRSFSYGEPTGARVLIAYASATGSTIDIAAEIGSTLGERGLSVDVRSLKENPPLDGYQAAVVGSPVHGGNWLPEAVEFVHANQSGLERTLAALFTVHLGHQGSDVANQKGRQAYLDRVRPLVPAVTEGYFTGCFDQRSVAMGAPAWIARLTPTMDFRDWDAIRAWASGLAAAL
jgi:menaquinone-dependent protoporphyrinogen oxidase